MTTAGGESVPRGSERILVAEDDANVRRVLTRTLERLGYDVVATTNGQEALDALASDRRGFALVILDVVMPVMGGIEAARHIWARHPALPLLLMTGYGPNERYSQALAALGIPLLRKPYGIAGLAGAVRDALG